MKELIKIKIQLLKQMHDYVLNYGDEDIYSYWAQEGVPDCPDDEIIEFIATHEDNWIATCKAFGNVLKYIEKEG